MNIVVFGGSGFLGSHVADALSEKGHKITVFDLKRSPYLRDDQQMTTGDILDKDLINEVIKRHDMVYHFAGLADIDECVCFPVDTIKVNVMGTMHILEACRKYKMKRLIFASSAYVYSNSGFFYSTSKRACESLIEDYHTLYGLCYTILRYGSLYGERSDGRNSIYKLIKQALLEKKITYYGTGDELREYIHVLDAAQSSVEILKPEFENQNIVLTGHESMRYRDLLEMIREMMGNTVEIEMKHSERKAHYKVTPYNFNPKLGKKLINNPHIDMGQGLLSCMAEIYEQLHRIKKEGIVVGAIK